VCFFRIYKFFSRLSDKNFMSEYKVHSVRPSVVFFCIRKMSELQVVDWKLETQAVVQLCRKKCDKSVSLSVLSMKNVTSSYIKVSLGHMNFRAPDSLRITVMLLGGSNAMGETTISATNHIGHNMHHIGHIQCRCRPQGNKN